MANQFDANIPQGRERIAFKRSSNTQATSLNSSTYNNNGVLVIDPNMVFDQSNKLVDRYVKQEDMVMYCSLIIYKGTESVITDKDGVRSNYNSQVPIEINLLNPLKSVNGNNFNFKNVFTSQWTDFFTSNAANNVNDQESYILDPETFGITNINYSVNANYMPMVDIQFTDIQGRMLFERGNDQNNPYNVFFTFPYPKFLLTFKGYYGKAIQIQLVLLTSTTRFDPTTGNYEVTAHFQGDVFSLLQTILNIYPYAAPFMFLMDDGVYLGQKILNKIYDEQNKNLTSLITDQTELSKYIINNNPTLYDLANCLKKIPFNTLGNTGQLDSSASNNDQILSVKTSIDTIVEGVNNFFNDTTKYLNTTGTTNNIDYYDIFTPINPNYNLNNYNMSDFNAAVSSFNDNIKQLQAMSTTKINFITGIKNRINANVILKNVITNFDINNALVNNYFYFNGNNSVYTLLYFNLLCDIITDEVSKMEAIIEDSYTNNVITDIGKVLGYQPSLGNIVRIIANNIQTFLILLEIIGINATKQIQLDSNRVRQHIANTTYKSNINNTIKYYSPFPYYYKTTNGVNGNKTLAYPAADGLNEDWFEVAFVEEIYTALTVLKNKTNLGKPQALFTPRDTGLSTIFLLGDQDMLVYENKRVANDILAELLNKYSLHASFSGMYYRGMTSDNLTNHYSANMAQFEIDLINKLVMQKINNTGSQFILKTALSNASKINGTKTNLGNFSLNYLKLGGTNTYKNIISQSVSEVNLYSGGSYTETEFNSIITTRNSLVTNNISGNPLYGKLYNSKTLQPTLFSLTQTSKTQELSVYANLTQNIFYYCDIDTTNSLNDINIGIQGVDNANYNTNSFQGFIWQLNKKLTDPSLPIISTNSNFASNITYGRTTVPALTFNTTMEDSSNISGDNNSNLFNNIKKPTNNIIQQYKKIIQL